MLPTNVMSFMKKVSLPRINMYILTTKIRIIRKPCRIVRNKTCKKMLFEHNEIRFLRRHSLLKNASETFCAYSMALIEYGSHRAFFVDYWSSEREHSMKGTYTNLYLTIMIFL